MPVTPRTFAILQAIQYEMQKDNKIVCSLQGAVGAATRPDGKSINLMEEFGLDRGLARLGQAIDEIWMTGSSVFYAFSGHAAITQLPGMTTMYPSELMFNAAGPYRYQTGGGIPSVPVVIWLAAPGRGDIFAEAAYDALLGHGSSLQFEYSKLNLPSDAFLI